jgi:hypothetical protein
MINPFTYGRSVALASNMGSRYLDMTRLGIEVYKLQDYKAAIEKLKKGDISKVMFNIKESGLKN